MKLNVPCVISRDVVYPVTTTLKPVDVLTNWRLEITGASLGMVNITPGAGVGVKSTPFAAKLAVRLIVPATVPVRRTALVDPPKAARVLPAGIAKFTVVPPLEN